MNCLAVAGFYERFPTGHVAPHLCLLAVPVAGLVGVAENIAVIVVAEPEVEVLYLGSIAAALVIHADAFLPDGGHAVDQHGAPDTGAIETACRSLDYFERLEIVKAQFIQI